MIAVVAFLAKLEASTTSVAKEKYAAKLGADCAYFISADPEDGDTVNNG